MSELIKENRILVVDDTIENIQLLGSFLQKDGYQLNVAQNGIQALDAVKAMPPDLILLDIMMPGMDGYETCERLKSSPETKDIPIIFLTAKVEPQDIVKGFAMGAVDYLTKPFNVEELLARVSTHLQLQRAKQEIKKQNQELKEAAKLREDIERIIRHDLRAPLNPIITYSQMMRMKENLSERGKKYLKIIEDSGHNMMNMINLSLELFKMERGGYHFRPVPINIIGVIEKIEIVVDELRKDKKIQIKKQINNRPIDENDTFNIQGEDLLCYSMMANLIKNAVEASPKGGTVLIELIREKRGVIRIHNQGAVPEEIYDRFFNKYVTSGKTAGTGLGTYSAKLIAEIQNGQIDMTSSAEKGTTITIRLPFWQL